MVSFIEDFKKVINEINNRLVKRNTKQIYFGDIIYYSCVHIRNGYSYDVINAYLTADNILNVSKNAMIKNKNNLELKYLDELNEKMLLRVSNKTTPRFIAVDGSYIYLSKKFSEYGYKISSNKYYCITLMSALFDIEKGVPLNYLINKANNEIDAQMSQLSLLNENDTIIVERLYFSYKLIKTLVVSGINIICRLKKSSKHVKLLGKRKSLTVTETIEDATVNIKIVCYKINNKPYYLATSNTGADPRIAAPGTGLNETELKYYYWKRWSIETHFRFVKYNTTLSNITSYDENSLLFDLKIHHFIFIMNSFLQYTS